MTTKTIANTINNNIQSNKAFFYPKPVNVEKKCIGNKVYHMHAKTTEIKKIKTSGRIQLKLSYFPLLSNQKDTVKYMK